MISNVRILIVLILKNVNYKLVAGIVLNVFALIIIPKDV